MNPLLRRRIALFVALIVNATFINAQNEPIRLGLPLGHVLSVWSAYFSPDGKYVLTGSDDHTAKIWDVTSGKLLYSLEGHSAGIGFALFSPNSKLVITASDGDTVAKVWDVFSGKLLHNLEEHRSDISSVQFSPDNKFVVIGSCDKIIKLWELKSGKLVDSIIASKESGNQIVSKGRYYSMYAYGVYDVRFSPDGKFILACSSKSAKIWDASSRKPLRNFEGHTDMVTSAAFSPDGKFLVTTSWDSTAIVWNVTSGQLLYKLRGHKGMVISAKFSPDGKFIATLSSDKVVKIWDSRNGKLLYSVDGDDVQFSQDGKFVVTNPPGLSASIWDVSSGKVLQSLDSLNRWSISSAEFSPDNKLVVTSALDFTARIWNVADGRLVQTLEGHTKQLSIIAQSVDGDKVAFPNSNGHSIQILSATTGKLIQHLAVNSGGFKSAAFSPDGKLLIVASGGAAVEIWDVTTGNLLHSLKGHSDGVDLASFSPDGKFAITTSWDSTAKIWNVANGKLLQSLNVNTFTLKSAQFSEDDKLVITNSWDSVVKIWDAVNGNLLHNLNHSDKVNSAQFSRSGKFLVTSSDDNTSKIWDVSSGELVHNLSGNISAVRSAQFSRDGNYVLTISNDLTAKIWDAVNGQLLYILEAQNHFVNTKISDKNGHESVKTQRVISDGIMSGEFSSDSKFLLTMGMMGTTAKLWDVTTGKLLCNLVVYGDLAAVSFLSNDKYVLAISYDGSYILFDTHTGQKLVQQFILRNNETVTLSPSGLFDATPGAMQEMYWLKGLEVIDFDQLKDRYWEPGLYEKIMKGEKLRDVRGMNELKSAPDIELGEIENNKLPITLTKRDGGYGRVVVYINDKETQADARGGGFDTSKPVQHLSINLKNNPLLIPGQKNTITVKAWSADGFVEGRGLSVTYAPKGADKQASPGFYAVICGISDYGSPSVHLNYPVRDANAISTAVTLGADNLFGKDSTHVYTLTSPGNLKPTKENIQKVFAEIGKKAKPQDILLVYLSGHGISWGQDKGDFYYLTSDAYSSSAEAYNDPVIRQKDAISTAEFTEWIKQIPALKEVMIIDACGSGKAVENLLAERTIDASQVKAIDRMKDRTGMFIISGCAANAVSYEASRYGQGLLTYCLLQAMKGAKLRDDKFVDVNDLLNYARENVPVMAQGIGGIQEPQLLIPKGGSFDIGLQDEKSRAMILLSNAKPVFVRSSFMNEEELSDDLKLSAYVDDQLNEISSKGTEAALVFVNATDYPDGYQITGLYSKSSQGWKLTCKMKRGEKENKFEVLSTNQDELRKKLITQITTNLR